MEVRKCAFFAKHTKQGARKDIQTEFARVFFALARRNPFPFGEALDRSVQTLERDPKPKN
jgi:hypothetical protein